MFTLSSGFVSEIGTFEIIIMSGTVLCSAIVTVLAIAKYRIILKKDQQEMMNKKADQTDLKKLERRVDKKMDRDDIILYFQDIKEHNNEKSEEIKTMFENYQEQHQRQHDLQTKMVNQALNQHTTIHGETLASILKVLKEEATK